MSELGTWQKVRADSENPATIESSQTQVLPGLILQFGCFQLNVKQLWPFICSSHWNLSKGRLSPISSSLPTPSTQLCFLKTERSRDSQLAELHKGKKKSCLSYLRAKQWDIDSATNFPMPLSGDKDDSQQNKKQIWRLLKAVTQTDSGHFPQATNEQIKPMWE